MALILYQRKNLVLHASACSKNKNVILFSGRSGSGKSTILQEACKKGYKFITEDVSAIQIYGNNTKVLPSFPLIKLEQKNLSEDLISRKILDVDKDRRNRELFQLKNNYIEKEKLSPTSCYFFSGKGDFDIETINNPIEKVKTVYKNIWRQVPYDSCKESEKIILSNISLFIRNTKIFKVILSTDIETSMNGLNEHLNN